MSAVVLLFSGGSEEVAVFGRDGDGDDGFDGERSDEAVDEEEDGSRT